MVPKRMLVKISGHLVSAADRIEVPARSTQRLVLQTQGSDGDNGCNLDGSEKVEVQAVSSDSNAASVK